MALVAGAMIESYKTRQLFAVARQPPSPTAQASMLPREAVWSNGTHYRQVQPTTALNSLWMTRCALLRHRQPLLT